MMVCTIGLDFGCYIFSLPFKLHFARFEGESIMTGMVIREDHEKHKQNKQRIIRRYGGPRAL